jgi:CRISPR-associated protein Cas8b/Csh1 subtype I-B
LLTTLISLGSDLNLDPIKVLVDKSNAKDIFVIELDRNCNYLDLKVNENEGEEKYLYKFAKEQVNRGKFITGLIKADKLKELKKILIQKDKNKKDSFYKDFKNGQITWILKQNILKNSKVLSILPKESKEILIKLKKEVVLKQNSIMDDFCKKIIQGNYERNILLTYRIGGKYLSEINGFSDFFQIAALGEENIKTEFSGRCMTCHNKAFLGKLNETLPFFTIDKYNFIPDGNKKNAHRAFQICKRCVINLISGFKYVSTNLNFTIPNSFGKIKLRFWLMPQLNDSSLIKDFLNKPDKNLSSFKDLFNISKEMELISELNASLDLTNIKYLKNYYNYIALFYTYNNGPRLIESIDGIYPPRFLELSRVKFYVDNIAKRNGNKFRFFFGLLVDFLEEYDYKKNVNKEKKGENERWMKIMSHIMNCIFTQKRINNSLIIKILMEKIKLILFNNNIDSFHEILLKAILILDYLYMVNALMPTANYNRKNSSSFSNNEKTDFVINFLNDHSSLLSTNNLRAICAIGIISGIIIKAQRRYFNSEKTPFLSRLNRLEMDIKRLGDLPRYDWIKLYHYKAKEFEDIFTYLTNYEISNLDYNDKIQKELMNLIFVVGIAHGFTIFTLFENKNWKIEN